MIFLKCILGVSPFQTHSNNGLLNLHAKRIPRVNNLSRNSQYLCWTVPSPLALALAFPVQHAHIVCRTCIKAKVDWGSKKQLINADALCEQSNHGVLEHHPEWFSVSCSHTSNSSSFNKTCTCPIPGCAAVLVVNLDTITIVASQHCFTFSYQSWASECFMKGVAKSLRGWNVPKSTIGSTGSQLITSFSPLGGGFVKTRSTWAARRRSASQRALVKRDKSTILGRRLRIDVPREHTWNFRSAERAAGFMMFYVFKQLLDATLWRTHTGNRKCSMQKAWRCISPNESERFNCHLSSPNPVIHCVFPFCSILGFWDPSCLPFTFLGRTVSLAKDPDSRIRSRWKLTNVYQKWWTLKNVPISPFK